MVLPANEATRKYFGTLKNIHIFRAGGIDYVIDARGGDYRVKVYSISVKPRKRKSGLAYSRQFVPKTRVSHISMPTTRKKIKDVMTSATFHTLYNSHNVMGEKIYSSKFTQNGMQPTLFVITEGGMARKIKNPQGQ